jgi:hypothetical protein
MYKTVICIILISCLIFTGCSSQETKNKPSSNKPNEVTTPKNNEVVSQENYEFEALDSSFGISLPNNWFVAQEMTPLETKPSRQRIFYASRQQDVMTGLFVFSKKDSKKLSGTEFADYFFKDQINYLKSTGKDFKELEHPADYENKKKTIKRFICDATINGLQMRHVYSLIEFKDSDKFIVSYQTCTSKEWDKHKESLFKIADSIHIKKDNK